MRAPRYCSPIRSLSASVSISAAAPLAAACARSLGLDRKLTSAALAASRGAMPDTSMSGAPSSPPPTCSTNCRSGIAISLRRLLVKRLQHFVGDIDARADIDRFLKYDVVLFGFGDLLDHPVGPFQHGCQFLIAA